MEIPLSEKTPTGSRDIVEPESKSKSELRNDNRYEIKRREQVQKKSGRVEKDNKEWEDSIRHNQSASSRYRIEKVGLAACIRRARTIAR